MCSLEQLGQLGQLYETAFFKETKRIYIIQATPSQCCWQVKKKTKL